MTKRTGFGHKVHKGALGFTTKSLRNFRLSLKMAKYKTEKAVEAGLKAGGIYIERESKKLVPIQYSPLIQSGRTVSKGSGVNTVVSIVYGTTYAVYVHEDLNKAHGIAYNQKYAQQIRNKVPGYFKKRPQESAKFLEKVTRDPSHQNEIQRIVMTVMQLKLR